MSEELQQELEQALTINEQFEALIAEADKLAIADFLNDQNISDVANLVYAYEEYEAQIIASLSIHRAASVFKILDLAEQKRIITELPPFKTAELLNELSADDRTDFLEELPSSVVRELIKLLNPEERKTTLSLLGYPENSVGRLMTPDYVWVYEHNTVAESIELIRRFGKDSETIDVIYVIDEDGNLVDDIKIRDIILSSPDKKINELIDGRVIVLHADDDQEVASDVFKMNNRVALPVVSKTEKLLGIVTIDDILWVATEEYSEDMQKIGGTEALDEPYLDTSVWKLFQKRVGWLVILFLGEMLTASVMQYFEEEIAKAVVLALFIPLIISSGGNTGSQASTLIIQALATGDVAITDWWRVFKREILSGLMLGTVLGVVGYFRILVWHSIFPNVYGDHYHLVGLTVGFTLLGIVLWGTLSGSMLPLALKKLGADPAVSSAPFVATLVDVTGLVIYFSVAYLFLQGILL
ncbi:magnesium transporter [Phnomibacter ginsenosidimutans]|jgi:magnesium transporter|uniref:Magnesium transporter MgtE n=1 Tax=Phnomibacter ginsenosidimutans TaxID=2676868 RepID=A0A6I6GXU3_9BACT|nr:magnesium transporter [Phnomibacter ginsenosidimutans]QGW27381.1 magnesium transporter [Phnomibacter ginsenosidimutans]